MVIPASVKLHAALPPETDDERQELKKQIEQNRLLIEQHAALLRENVRLLELTNRAAADLDEAEEARDNINISLEMLRNDNKTLADELAAKTKRVTPKPTSTKK